MRMQFDWTACSIHLVKRLSLQPICNTIGFGTTLVNCLMSMIITIWNSFWLSFFFSKAPYGSRGPVRLVIVRCLNFQTYLHTIGNFQVSSAWPVTIIDLQVTTELVLFKCFFHLCIVFRHRWMKQCIFRAELRKLHQICMQWFYLRGNKSFIVRFVIFSILLLA